MPWQLIASFIGGTLSDYFKNKGEIAREKEKARIRNVTEGIPGFSDDIMRIVWSAPFVGVFLPGGQETVIRGFEAIQHLPDWYIGGFISISFATFGIDKIFKWRR